LWDRHDLLEPVLYDRPLHEWFPIHILGRFIVLQHLEAVLQLHLGLLLPVLGLHQELVLSFCSLLEALGACRLERCREVLEGHAVDVGGVLVPLGAVGDVPVSFPVVHADLELVQQLVILLLRDDPSHHLDAAVVLQAERTPLTPEPVPVVLCSPHVPPFLLGQDGAAPFVRRVLGVVVDLPVVDVPDDCEELEPHLALAEVGLLG